MADASRSPVSISEVRRSVSSGSDARRSFLHYGTLLWLYVPLASVVTQRRIEFIERTKNKAVLYTNSLERIKSRAKRPSKMLPDIS